MLCFKIFLLSSPFSMYMYTKLVSLLISLLFAHTSLFALRGGGLVGLSRGWRKGKEWVCLGVEGGY